MLKENILYKENLPVNCSIMDLDEYPIHFHNDLEIVYVLQGNVRLKNGYYNYNMKEGDIYILNDREIHSYYGMNESNAVLILQLNLGYFGRYYEILRNSFFVTDMNGAQDDSIDELQELLAKIGLENLGARKGYEKRVIDLAHALINCLINNFQYFAMEDGKFVNEFKNKGNKILAGRLSRITEYMYDNYSRRLTLTEIAEREHLSIYYLSHFIKEATGLSFQELLSFIRVEESEKLLLSTDKKIGAISVESGFSAVRYYIKYFTKWFGMHPADYRKEYTDKVQSKDTAANFILLSGKEIENLLRCHVKDIFGNSLNSQAEVVKAEFDAEEFIWKEENYCESFASIMKADFMKPISGLLGMAGARKEDIVKTSPGYAIMRHPSEGVSGDRYSILFYNISENLVKAELDNMSRQSIEEEIKKYEKHMEFFIKLTGVSGMYRIAHCKFSKESLLSRYRKEENQGESLNKLLNKREMLINSWISAPAFSVETVNASQILNIQAHQAGSSVELILIDPVQ